MICPFVLFLLCVLLLLLCALLLCTEWDDFNHFHTVVVQPNCLIAMEADRVLHQILGSPSSPIQNSVAMNMFIGNEYFYYVITYIYMQVIVFAKLQK